MSVRPRRGSPSRPRRAWDLNPKGALANLAALVSSELTRHHALPWGGDVPGFAVSTRVMNALHLPHPSSASLLVIDVQERLLPAMPTDSRDEVVRNISNLITLFQDFDGDIVLTEQYPRGLGPTVPALLDTLAPHPVRRFEKTAFSACQEPTIHLDLRPDVVLVGMEAHICVLLTGLDLVRSGHRVFVPGDAIASRRPSARDNGLALLASAGATPITTETLIFATLGRAGGPTFKKFSALIR